MCLAAKISVSELQKIYKFSLTGRVIQAEAKYCKIINQ